jgi:excisionase family DNA binding protein|tara:strand:- start:193 stop:432 length:240 start_codon:yes stop_codon:yes gene_type:complete
MTSQEVSRYLRCSVTTVRRLVGKREMPHFRLGKLVRFRRSEIDAWLNLHHEGELPADGSREPLLHPDQLFLFAREVGRG